jgi:hypothetical protein
MAGIGGLHGIHRQNPKGAGLHPVFGVPFAKLGNLHVIVLPEMSLRQIPAAGPGSSSRMVWNLSRRASFGFLLSGKDRWSPE